MSDLTNAEKRQIEKLLKMSSGYVLNFSNRTFDEFIADSTGKEIYDSKYDSGSGSKANRLRAFWSIEPNHVVGKLTADLLVLIKELGVTEEDAPLTEVCNRIVGRLNQGAPVVDIEAINPKSAEKEFAVIARSIRDAIDKNEPETGLDCKLGFRSRHFSPLFRRQGYHHSPL